MTFHEKRATLVELLKQAAEIEHVLTCQYLFAAFALRLTDDDGTDAGTASPGELEHTRRWKSDLLLIARQEMAHLAGVSNLLAALGEAPHFGLPQFPVPASYFPVERPLPLTPVTEDFLQTMIDIEARGGANSIYEPIERLFRELSTASVSDLFVGSRIRQVDNSLVLPNYPDTQRANRQPRYDIVITKIEKIDDVTATIKRLREEGAGTLGGAPGHVALLRNMLEELRDLKRANPRFEPSRHVVTNPWRPTVVQPTPPVGVTPLTDGFAIEVAGLFDLGYGVMLRLLAALFSRSELTRPSFDGAQAIVFFPMMSLVIRPLGEVLTLVPAHSENRRLRAGPTFTCSQWSQNPPSPESIARILAGELAELRDTAGRVVNLAPSAGPLRERLQFLTENTWRIHRNFCDYAGLP